MKNSFVRRTFYNLTIAILRIMLYEQLYSKTPSGSRKFDRSTNARCRQKGSIVVTPQRQPNDKTDTSLAGIKQSPKKFELYFVNLG